MLKQKILSISRKHFSWSLPLIRIAKIIYIWILLPNILYIINYRFNAVKKKKHTYVFLQLAFCVIQHVTVVVTQCLNHFIQIIKIIVLLVALIFNVLLAYSRNNFRTQLKMTSFVLISFIDIENTISILFLQPWNWSVWGVSIIFSIITYWLIFQSYNKLVKSIEKKYKIFFYIINNTIIFLIFFLDIFFNFIVAIIFYKWIELPSKTSFLFSLKCSIILSPLFLIIKFFFLIVSCFLFEHIVKSRLNQTENQISFFTKIKWRFQNWYTYRMPVAVLVFFLWFFFDRRAFWWFNGLLLSSFFVASFIQREIVFALLCDWKTWNRLCREEYPPLLWQRIYIRWEGYFIMLRTSFCTFILEDKGFLWAKALNYFLFRLVKSFFWFCYNPKKNPSPFYDFFIWENSLYIFFVLIINLTYFWKYQLIYAARFRKFLLYITNYLKKKKIK